MFFVCFPGGFFFVFFRLCVLCLSFFLVEDRELLITHTDTCVRLIQAPECTTLAARSLSLSVSLSCVCVSVFSLSVSVSVSVFVFQSVSISLCMSLCICNLYVSLSLCRCMIYHLPTITRLISFSKILFHRPSFHRTHVSTHTYVRWKPKKTKDLHPSISRSNKNQSHGAAWGQNSHNNNNNNNNNNKSIPKKHSPLTTPFLGHKT